MDKIVLNDGTELTGGIISKDMGNNRIYISVPGITIMDAAITFSDPDKSSVMVCYTSVYKYTFNGFTKIDSIGFDPVNRNITIYMSGSDDSSISREYTVPEIYLPEEMRTGNEVLNNE